MKRHPFATLFGFIALTAISANANAKSLEEAARDFVARDFSTYVGQPIPNIWVIRYEVGTPSVSDRYPSAIAENLVPRETTVYPIRILWWAKGWGLRRSDFFLFQDSFGTWKHFYTHLGSIAKNRSSILPLYLLAASASESENDALITEEQRRTFEGLKQNEAAVAQAQAEAREARPWYDVYGQRYQAPGGAQAGSPGVAAAGRTPPQPTPAPRAEKAQAQAAARADQAAPKAAPVVRATPASKGRRPSNAEASVAMNRLQDALGKPHVKGGVRYDPKTDSYNWIGPKLGKPMSLPANEFLSDVGPYLY